jgi:hypothetical protein
MHKAADSYTGVEAEAKELAERILQANRVGAYGGMRAEQFGDVYPLQWFQAVKLAEALERLYATPTPPTKG